VEIDFYLVMADVFDRIHAAGIPMCFPRITNTKRIDIVNAYDVTLLAKGETAIIPNDIYFDQSEPFFYLTGANGGGKTTYLRTVGVSCLLFINGCPAPCDRAEIFPLSCVFTHFPHDERFNNSGRYAEEKSRVDTILNSASKTAASGGCSLVLLNETYSTTSEETARPLTTALAEHLYHSGDFGVYVTHQHNVGETEIPYLNVLIDRGDQNRRTFKVAKQKSVYSSYAYDILKKYALTKEDLDRRFK
jgi:DNA mismatch repair ATPase MutS